jgi:hypothetical protein
MDWISKADFEIKILVAGQFIFLFFDDTQWLFSMKPVN